MKTALLIIGLSLSIFGQAQNRDQVVIQKEISEVTEEIQKLANSTFNLSSKKIDKLSKRLSDLDYELKYIEK